jgi:hypothetical protein
LSNSNLDQIEVELGDLKEMGNEFARLLEARLKTDVEMNGNKLTLGKGSSHHSHPKEVKTQIKHVLHHMGFSQNYRVLSDHSRIRIVRLEKKERHAEKEGVAPNPAQTLPYLFPT